jgi:hypothetical protein
VIMSASGIGSHSKMQLNDALIAFCQAGKGNLTIF